METVTSEPIAKETITTNVAAAVIEYGGRYLLMKRAEHKGNGGMWEFPGGKVDPGESLQQAVEREIQEELGIKATTGRLLGTAETYDRGLIQNRVLRLFGIETFIENEPKDLKDHSEFLWVRPEEFSRFPMTPAEYGLLSSLKNVLSTEREITNLSMWSVVKLSAVVHAIIGIFVGAFIFVTSMALPFSLSVSQRTAGVIVIPLLNIIFGICVGAAFAMTYNLYASIFGGLKIRVK